MTQSVVYPASSLIGGVTGSVDNIPSANLHDMDACIVHVKSGNVYHYVYDVSSELIEVSPEIICPDDNEGAGRWILTDVKLKSHNHTSGADDGGVLTDDEHDGFSEFTALDTTPSAPVSGKSRLYNFVTAERNFLEFLHSDGIIIRLGRDTAFVVRCDEDDGIPLHKAVYVTGATGGRPNVKLAKANNASTMPALGMSMTAMSHGNYGLVLVLGKLWGFDASDYTDGAPLFVSASVAGDLTDEEPAYPNIKQTIGVVGDAKNNGNLLLYQASYKEQLSHADLSNIGTTTHANIDLALANYAAIKSDTFFVTGFADRTKSTLSLSTRTLTIAPTVTSFDIYSAGVKYTKIGGASCSTEIANTQGLHFIYFDSSGVLQNSMDVWDITSANVPVCTVYWNGTAGVIFEERHSAGRNLAWHSWAHHTIGTRYDWGLGGTFASDSTTIAEGEIHDEDIEHGISAQNSVRLWYRDAGNKLTFDSPAVAVTAKIVTGALKYDASGTLTSVSAGSYVANWIYGTLEQTAPIMCVIGQSQGSLSEMRSLGLPTFPNVATAELKLLYKVIWRNVGGTPTFIESIDYRQSSTLPAGGTSAPHASSVVVTPTGDIASANVQAALVELDTEKRSIIIVVPSVDLTPTPIEIEAGFNAGENVAFPNLVFFGSGGKWLLADADAEATVGDLGIALETKSDGQALQVLKKGYVRNDAWDWTVGGRIYVSTDAGGLTQTPPSGTDDVIMIVGRAKTADIILFDPSKDYITHV